MAKAPMYRVPFLQKNGSHNGTYTRKPEEVLYAGIGVEADCGDHKIWSFGRTEEEALRRIQRIQKKQHGTAFELSEVYVLPRSGEPTLVQQ